MKGNERNKPCPCGRSAKYKNCCGRNNASLDGKRIPPQDIPPAVYAAFERKEIEETIRKQQQGLGRPIISANFQGNTVVAVGSNVHFSPSWKTFPDFLFDFILLKLGKEWCELEFKKPIQSRHPIMYWHNQVCLLQQKTIVEPGQITSMNMNGALYCYYGLSYSLYLLNHNVELQEIYIHRLKDLSNFQGTYYELMVANSLIRAGFKLELEDETDETTKHCEFSATSIATGKRYWVEAKARSVAGVLGKSLSNGTTSKDPTGQLSRHVKGALEKPADGERLIFVDLNAPAEPNPPSWVGRVQRKLDDKERDLLPDQSAYIFVTNMCFHLDLTSENHNPVLMAYGLGIDDFAKRGRFTCSQIYRMKKKHRDAHSIAESFLGYGKLPITLDGRLPSEAFAEVKRDIKIGETYFFNEIGNDGLVATVASATVFEDEKKIIIGTDHGDLISMPITDDQLADYRNHKEVYFGKKVHVGKRTTDSYEFFEEMVKIHLEHPTDSILKKVRHYSDFDTLAKLSHEDLVVEYCERLYASLPNLK